MITNGSFVQPISLLERGWLIVEGEDDARVELQNRRSPTKSAIPYSCFYQEHEDFAPAPDVMDEKLLSCYEPVEGRVLCDGSRKFYKRGNGGVRKSLFSDYAKKPGLSV